MASMIFASAATILAVCALVYVLNLMWEKGRTALRRRRNRRRVDVIAPLFAGMLRGIDQYNKEQSAGQDEEQGK